MILTGAASWLHYATNEDWVEVAYMDSGESVVTGDSAAGLSVDPVQVPESFDPRARQPFGAEPATRTELQSAATPAKVIDPALGFEVRVVAKASGQPVADAAVYYYDTLSPTYDRFRRARGLYQRDRELALTKFGDLARTAANGVAILPHGIPTQSIAVRCGELYGELQVSTRRPPPVDGYLVELQVDHTLRVQVVDDRDQPVAGVHVVFHIPIRDQAGSTRWVMIPDRTRKTEGADGIQTIKHIQQGIDAVRQLGAGETRVYVGLDIPGLTRCGPELDIGTIPAAPVKLVMPALGSVSVRVRDADGAPVRRRLRLSAEPDFSYPDRPGAARLAAQRPHWELDTDPLGQARFARVAPGQKYRIEAVGAAVQDGERAEFAGPGQAGEVVEVELRREFTAAMVSGVAFGADGGPLRRVVLTYVAHGEKPGRDLAYLTRGTAPTDDAGRFTIRLPPTAMVRDKQQRLVETNLYSELKLAVAGGNPLRAGAAVQLPRRLLADRYQVGEVRLRLPDLLAAGRVFIDDLPVERCDGMLVEFCNPDRRNRWENAAGLGVYPQPGGRFEIRGSDGGRQLRLRPRAWGFLPAPALPFAPGDKNLEVRLYRGGYLRAVVLHDQVVSGAEIDVRLRAVAIDRAIDDALSWRFVGRVDKRGSGNLMLRKAYWWSGLPPGEFRLELRLLGASQPFMVREHLRPQFGSDRVEDLPFEVLNLRGQIHRVTVRAVDSRQRPLAGLAIPLDQTTLVGVEGVKMAGKGAVLYSTNALQNVLVVVRGYRPEKVFGISGEHVVRLQPGIPITVNLPSISLPAGLGLAVQIRRRDYRPAETYRVGLRHPVVERAGARYLADLVGERSITLRYRGRRQWKTTLMEHGQFVLDLHLVRKGKPPVRLPGYGPRVLMVRDTSVEHEFGIKVNGKRLREAIEQMGLQPPPPRGAGKQRKARGAGGKAQRAGNGSGPKK